MHLRRLRLFLGFAAVDGIYSTAWVLQIELSRLPQHILFRE